MGGLTTQDIKRFRLSARGVALAYNWWSLFVRLANSTTRLEAITIQPFLLAGVAGKTRHAGQQPNHCAHARERHPSDAPANAGESLAEDMEKHCGAIAPEIRLAVCLRADYHKGRQL